MKRMAIYYRATATKAALSSIAFAMIGTIAPAKAEDKNQRDALLEAALQRISALEAKVGRINSLEDENRQLRSKLVKVETKSDAAIRATSKSAKHEPKVLAYAASPGSTVSDLAPTPKTTLWEGAYAGINAGYGTGALRTYTNTTTIDKPSNSVEEISNSYDTSYLGGGLAGGQFGYNHVLPNHILVGAEADINWADVYNNSAPNNTSAYTLGTTARTNPRQPIETTSTYGVTYARVGMDWVGTVRGRLGYDLGKFLPYVTAGLAYGGISSSNHTHDTEVGYKLINYLPPTPPTSVFEPSGSYTMGKSGSISAGWAAGAGAEYMVADGWSVKGEYLYTSIGGVTTPQISQNTEASDQKAFTTNNTGSFGVHQARVGLNYHPGWSFTEPVLAAKY